MIFLLWFIFKSVAFAMSSWKSQEGHFILSVWYFGKPTLSNKLCKRKWNYILKVEITTISFTSWLSLRVRIEYETQTRHTNSISLGHCLRNNFGYNFNSERDCILFLYTWIARAIHHNQWGSSTAWGGHPLLTQADPHQLHHNLWGWRHFLRQKKTSAPEKTPLQVGLAPLPKI